MSEERVFVISKHQWQYFAACWLDRGVSDQCQTISVRREGLIERVRRGTRPAVHVGRRIDVPISPRNNAASGQLAANASLIRLAVSLTRTAIFSNRSRMVENSPLASGCGPGDGVADRAHQPISGGVQDQPHLVGQRRAATGAVGGQLALVPLDQVLRLTARAIEAFIEPLRPQWLMLVTT